MTSFGVIIEKDDNGYYAHIPAVQGCYAQGDTYEEVLTNIQEVLHLILEEIVASGQKIPLNEQISLTTIDVTV